MVASNLLTSILLISKTGEGGFTGGGAPALKVKITTLKQPAMIRHSKNLPDAPKRNIC